VLSREYFCEVLILLSRLRYVCMLIDGVGVCFRVIWYSVSYVKPVIDACISTTPRVYCSFSQPAVQSTSRLVWPASPGRTVSISPHCTYFTSAFSSHHFFAISSLSILAPNTKLAQCKKACWYAPDCLRAPNYYYYYYGTRLGLGVF